MNNRLKKISAFALSAVLTATFIVIMHFAAPKIANLSETVGELTYRYDDVAGDGSELITEKTAVIGEDVTAVRISDLKKLNKITKVNYVADRFVSPSSLSSDIQIVDLTKPFEFAEKGTLIFVIMNLDPESPDFVKQSDKLADYKIGDYWQFTLSLPRIFSASNIYRKDELVARHGEIENYDFIKFNTSYDKYTKNYSPKVARMTFNLSFYTRRQALNNQIITIHYQSLGSVYSGISDCPVIGDESAVTYTIASSQNFLIAFAVLGIVVTVVLIVLSLLKRTTGFCNAIIWILGIVLMLFPRFMLGQGTSAPLLCQAFSWAAAFIMLVGALTALGRNFGKVPTKYIFPALMAAGGILAFIYPFAPFGAARILRIIYLVIKEIGAVALLVFTGFAAFTKNDKHTVLETITASLISVSTIAAVFVPQVFPVYCYSMFWLCVIAVITTFIGVFVVFRDTEKANEYLTANLHIEVEQQVKDIKAVITERDNLLRFVSHDMKKPLQSSASLIDVLIQREQDAEQAKALQIVRHNTARVIDNLSEIGSYARFNYIAESAQITDLSELCAALYDFHHPDCNANGIILKNLVDKKYNVFVKRHGLENAVSNIIINAVEHASCSTITLSATTDKDKTVLSVADDGKGIAEGVEIFRAYSSEKPDKPETGGVGLYICKNIIESMGGKLTYESGQSGTVFHISLLKA